MYVYMYVYMYVDTTDPGQTTGDARARQRRGCSISGLAANGRDGSAWTLIGTYVRTYIRTNERTDERREDTHEIYSTRKEEEGRESLSAGTGGGGA